MVTSGGTPSAGYKFNSFEEIKSHSSILYNERQAILFYLLDMRSIDMNTSSNISDMLTTRAILKQIYKNIRMLLRYNPVVRSTLDLETQDKGIYVPDVAIGMIDKMIEFCEKHGWTQKKIYIVIQELNNLEMLIKDILQYFHYFIRPDFKQKPDIEIATLKYKQIADDRTIEELKDIVGKSHKVDFENLGIQKIEVKEKMIDIPVPESLQLESNEWDIKDYDDAEEDNEGSNSESDGTYDSKEDDYEGSKYDN